MGWEQAFLQLKSKNDNVGAIALLRSEIAKGSLAAQVRLAIEHKAAGLSYDEADRIIDQALESVKDNDAEAHWHLSCALELMLGSMDPSQKHAQSFIHLQKSAELTGNPNECFAVAVNYHFGGAGVKPSKDIALFWYSQALQGGHPEARKYMDELKNN